VHGLREDLVAGVVGMNAVGKELRMSSGWCVDIDDRNTFGGSHFAKDRQYLVVDDRSVDLVAVCIGMWRERQVDQGMGRNL
jgi:hypothetical protein